MVPPPVVFIPGMMLDERLFAAQIDAIRATHATSVADITGAASIEELARQVLANAPERFALVGLSMGGIVGLEMYRQGGERITHLALLDTTPAADRPDRSAQRLGHMAAVERGGLADVLRDSMLPLYLAARHRSDPVLLGRIMDMGLALGAQTFCRQSRALRDRRDSRALLESIACPTLVLCGREDQLCPVDIHLEMAAAIPGADLVVLSRAGHLTAMEAPAAVTTALRLLLERVH